jgi:AcrR family transcriptional regulator
MKSERSPDRVKIRDKAADRVAAGARSGPDNKAVRILNIAAEMFILNGFDMTPIADIASAAHCSTATIYDLFANKIDLYRSSMKHIQSTYFPPQLKSAVLDEDIFPEILLYSYERIKFLGLDRSRSMTLAWLMRLEEDAPILRDLYRAWDQIAPLQDALRRAVKAGHIRNDIPIENAAYLIMASISFEPLIMNLMKFGAVECAPLIRTVFLPFVTDEGLKVAERWLNEYEPDTSDPDGTWQYLDAIHNE